MYGHKYTITSFGLDPFFSLSLPSSSTDCVSSLKRSACQNVIQVSGYGTVYNRGAQILGTKLPMWQNVLPYLRGLPALRRNLCTPGVKHSFIYVVYNFKNDKNNKQPRQLVNVEEWYEVCNMITDWQFWHSKLTEHKYIRF